jgi:hypothetical protein
VHLNTGCKERAQGIQLEFLAVRAAAVKQRLWWSPQRDGGFLTLPLTEDGKRAGVIVPKSTDCERLSELLDVDVAWLCASEA